MIENKQTLGFDCSQKHENIYSSHFLKSRTAADAPRAAKHPGCAEAG